MGRGTLLNPVDMTIKYRPLFVCPAEGKGYVASFIDVDDASAADATYVLLPYRDLPALRLDQARFGAVVSKIGAGVRLPDT
jgi:hypothetical protein